jgi:hypothetical protein
VAEGRRADFEAVFGPGGIWTRLLYQSDGYRLTEVRCESPESRQYRVRDFWAGHRSFENFRWRLQLEYERFGSWIFSDGLVEKEQFLGAYYERKDNGSEEDLGLS